MATRKLTTAELFKEIYLREVKGTPNAYEREMDWMNLLKTVNGYIFTTKVRNKTFTNFHLFRDNSLLGITYDTEAITTTLRVDSWESTNAYYRDSSNN